MNGYSIFYLFEYRCFLIKVFLIEGIVSALPFLNKQNKNQNKNILNIYKMNKTSQQCMEI